jgi:hypothetical protein
VRVTNLHNNFLYRWDLTDEPFPDFSQRSAWYGTQLIKTTGRDIWG